MALDSCNICLLAEPLTGPCSESTELDRCKGSISTAVLIIRISSNSWFRVWKNSDNSSYYAEIFGVLGGPCSTPNRIPGGCPGPGIGGGVAILRLCRPL